MMLWRHQSQLQSWARYFSRLVVSHDSHQSWPIFYPGKDWHPFDELTPFRSIGNSANMWASDNSNLSGLCLIHKKRNRTYNFLIGLEAALGSMKRSCLMILCLNLSKFGYAKIIELCKLTLNSTRNVSLRVLRYQAKLQTVIFSDISSDFSEIE